MPALEITSQQPAQKQATDPFFLPDFCGGSAVLVLILVSELFVVTMVLAATGITGFSWDYLAMVSLMVQWVALSSAYALCKLRPTLAQLSLPQAVLAIYGIILGLTVALTLLANTILSGAYGQGLVSDSYAVLRNVLVSAIMTGMVLRYFYLQAKLRQQEQAELTARIQALQARIRPHFLFNCMNSIASLIHIDPDRAEQVVEDLSDLFRASLGSDDPIPLRQEITLCQQYAGIEQLRLGERLRLNWQQQGDLDTASIPQLTLQPLVENAIYHGVQPLPEGGQIDIALTVTDTVDISISNPCPTAQTAKHKGNQLALDNIRRRLHAHYGPSAKLNTEINGDTFVARLSYPNPTIRASKD